jgi:hypothetical protein
MDIALDTEHKSARHSKSCYGKTYHSKTCHGKTCRKCHKAKKLLAKEKKAQVLPFHKLGRSYKKAEKKKALKFRFARAFKHFKYGIFINTIYKKRDLYEVKCAYSKLYWDFKLSLKKYFINDKSLNDYIVSLLSIYVVHIIFDITLILL